VAHELQDLGPTSVTRFFAGAGLCLDGVQFGFVMKRVLYLRVDDASRSRWEAVGCQPFSYATRTRQITVPSYYQAQPEVMDEPDVLRELAMQARVAAGQAEKRKPRSRSAPRLFEKGKKS
jgi:DNA transformation protein and related proteins